MNQRRPGRHQRSVPETSWFLTTRRYEPADPMYVTGGWRGGVARALRTPGCPGAQSLAPPNVGASRLPVRRLRRAASTPTGTLRTRTLVVRPVRPAPRRTPPSRLYRSRRRSRSAHADVPPAPSRHGRRRNPSRAAERAVSSGCTWCPPRSSGGSVRSAPRRGVVHCSHRHALVEAARRERVVQLVHRSLRPA